MTTPNVCPDTSPKINYFGDKPLPKSGPTFGGRVFKSILNAGGTALLLTIAAVAAVATFVLTMSSYALFMSGVGIPLGIGCAVGALATGWLAAFTFSKSLDCFIGIFGSFC